MIAYEVLVQTIADWKAGARPAAPVPAAPVEAVEELDSGMVTHLEGSDGDWGFTAESIRIRTEDEEGDSTVGSGSSPGEIEAPGTCLGSISTWYPCTRPADTLMVLSPTLYSLTLSY